MWGSYYNIPKITRLSQLNKVLVVQGPIMENQMEKNMENEMETGNLS